MKTTLKSLLFSLLLFIMTSNSFAQSEIVNIWDDKIPNYQETTEEEIIEETEITRISLVKEPTLEIFYLLSVMLRVKL